MAGLWHVLIECGLVVINLDTAGVSAGRTGSSGRARGQCAV